MTVFSFKVNSVQIRYYLLEWSEKFNDGIVLGVDEDELMACERADPDVTEIDVKLLNKTNDEKTQTTQKWIISNLEDPDTTSTYLMFSIKCSIDMVLSTFPKTSKNKFLAIRGKLIHLI